MNYAEASAATRVPVTYCIPPGPDLLVPPGRNDTGAVLATERSSGGRCVYGERGGGGGRKACMRLVSFSLQQEQLRE
jgi:hypothetical protein